MDAGSGRGVGSYNERGKRGVCPVTLVLLAGTAAVGRSSGPVSPSEPRASPNGIAGKVKPRAGVAGRQ